jgi:hypothetical protein
MFSIRSLGSGFIGREFSGIFLSKRVEHTKQSCNGLFCGLVGIRVIKLQMLLSEYIMLTTHSHRAKSMKSQHGKRGKCARVATIHDSKTCETRDRKLS